MSDLYRFVCYCYWDREVPFNVGDFRTMRFTSCTVMGFLGFSSYISFEVLSPDVLIAPRKQTNGDSGCFGFAQQFILWRWIYSHFKVCFFDVVCFQCRLFVVCCLLLFDVCCSLIFMLFVVFCLMLFIHDISVRSILHPLETQLTPAFEAKSWWDRRVVWDTWIWVSTPNGWIGSRRNCATWGGRLQRLRLTCSQGQRCQQKWLMDHRLPIIQKTYSKTQ